MGTMMALRAHARSGPEQLVYEQAPAGRMQNQAIGAPSAATRS
jgi:hypothetical protein